MTMAPCNCGGKKKTTSSQYTFTLNGQTQTYDTEVQAKAAQIRAGGGGVVKPA